MQIQVFDESKSHDGVGFIHAYRHDVSEGWTDDDLIFKYTTTGVPPEVPGFLYLWGKPHLYSTKRFYREPNPTDKPPGIGYNAKVEARAYISNKDYTRGYTLVTKPMFGRDYQVRQRNGIVYQTLQSYVSLIEWTPKYSLELGIWPNLSNVSEIAEGHAAAERQALVNLYGSLNKRKDIELGVLLVELRESLGTVTKGALTIFKILRALKRGRISDAYSALKKHFGGDLKTRKGFLNRDKVNKLRKQKGQPPISKADYASNMWLELQFGWLPILSDIFKVLEIMQGALSSEASSPHLFFSGYGTYTCDCKDVKVRNIASSMLRIHSFDPLKEAGHEDNQLWTTFDGKHTMKFAYHASFKVSNDLVSILSQLGLVNPLSIAWEVVPLSFVVDWFLPVGNWLDSFTATAGLELIQLSRSVKVETHGTVKRTYEGWLRTYNSYIDGQGNPQVDSWLEAQTCEGSTPVSESRFHRLGTLDDSTLPPMPLPELHFSEILDPWKAVTSLALLKRLS